MAEEPGRLSRFGHLEIGLRRPPAGKAPPDAGRDGRLPPAVPQADITIVLDGLTYRSTDPNVPPDIRVLMERIAKEGYSEQLIEDWKAGRARKQGERQSKLLFSNKAEDESTGDGVFKGERVSVIKLDGKVYTSDDPSLPADIKELFFHLDAYGVTPDLMEKLRALGGKVTVHSEGDLAFWRDVMDDTARRRAERWADAPANVEKLLMNVLAYVAAVAAFGWLVSHAVSRF